LVTPSAVLIELERRRASVTYVRTTTGHGVDFLARGAEGELELIQVCSDASDPATAQRGLRGLSEAGHNLPELATATAHLDP
jgi:predicted AAA+ superfamily ATPase